MKRMIMFNEDNTHQFYEYNEAGVRPTPQIAREYIAQYAGSQITDYLINVNSMNSSFPSRVLTSYDEKYLQKRENGLDVDYTGTHAKAYYQMFVEDKWDMYAEWIRLLRDIGIRPWLSFRMDDCHENGQQAGFMLCDYYHEHPELRRTAHRGAEGYFDNCYDYAHPEVRQRMLDYIDEALERYDVDGVELDFVREPFIFSIGGEEDGRQILKDFIREVRAIMARYKQMPLLIRVPHSPEVCWEMGFDMVGMAREGLVDIIAAAPHFVPTDNNIPVEYWKSILAPYDVAFTAVTELSIKKDEKFWLNTHETALATCFQHLSAGADFVYLFNYMRSNASNYNDPENYIMYSDLYKWDNYQHLIHNAGSYDTAIRCVRRHIPTYHDYPPGEGQPPFPQTLDAPGHYPCVKIRTGDVPAGARVTLILGCSDLDTPETPLPPDNFEVYINSRPLRCTGTVTVTPAFTQKQGYCFAIDPSVIRAVNAVEFALPRDGHGRPFEVDYAEIRVEPQNV